MTCWMTCYRHNIVRVTVIRGPKTLQPWISRSITIVKLAAVRRLKPGTGRSWPREHYGPNRIVCRLNAPNWASAICSCRVFKQKRIETARNSFDYLRASLEPCLFRHLLSCASHDALALLEKRLQQQSNTVTLCFNFNDRFEVQRVGLKWVILIPLQRISRVINSLGLLTYIHKCERHTLT